MRIATNVSRNPFGGITISNVELFDWMEDGTDTVVGIEYLAERYVPGAVIFRKYDPAFFEHHIINCLDVLQKHSWEKTWFRSSLIKSWRVLIDETKKILVAAKPDVVLLNGTYNVPFIMSIAARELGLPIVLRYAGVLQRELGNRSQLIKRRLWEYEREIALHADAYIFPSRLCEKIVQTEIAQRKLQNSHVVYNPTKPVKARARSVVRHRIIAAVGRWSPVKNFQDFVAVHQVLRAEKWSHRAQLVTSVRTPPSWVSSGIELVAPMSREEIQRYYAGIALLMVPSTFETFCNVAAEALLAGTPVLVSEQVGFAEVLHRVGLSSMVVKDFKNPHEVAQRVKDLVGKKIPQATLKRVAALLDPHGIHQSILTILKETTGEI